MFEEVKYLFNRVKEVFTKEYKDETEYLEFQKNMVSKIKLNEIEENIDDKISRLAGYTSDFSLAIGSYEDECVRISNNKVKKLRR